MTFYLTKTAALLRIQQFIFNIIKLSKYFSLIHSIKFFKVERLMFIPTAVCSVVIQNGLLSTRFSTEVTLLIEALQLNYGPSFTKCTG